VRVGVVGGTFDPIHLGHLLMAEEARVRLDLDEVIFIPAGQPWMKSDSELSPAHHRFNMARLGVEPNPFFRASSMEIDRPGPTYTVETLSELHREARGEDDYYFVLGADSLAHFHSWKEPGRIMELCTLVAAPRPGREDSDLGNLDAIRPGASEKLVVLAGPAVDISGTCIRHRSSLGLSVRYQVPEQVERYMHRYGLYRDVEIRH
jgi:nicotinate-nucleotide adenylyltransferase